MTAQTQQGAGASEASNVRIGVCGDGLAGARAREAGVQISRVMRTDVTWVDVACATSSDAGAAGAAGAAATGTDPEHDSAACVQSLRSSLAAEECDVIVHALREVPRSPAPGLVIGAIPERSDARDALFSRGHLALDGLPAASRVGGESPRRRAQLRWARQELGASFEIVEAPAGLERRLQLVADGELDAVVVDAANLERLGLIDEASEFFELTTWPTTPGQGALALEVRGEDARTNSAIRAMLAKLDHRPTRAATTAERVVLDRLDGQGVPFGASAIIDSGMLLLGATGYTDDGRRFTSSHGVVLDGMSPAQSKVAVEALGRSVADDLLRQGDRAAAGRGR